jgi:hypothetical protein
MTVYSPRELKGLEEEGAAATELSLRTHVEAGATLVAAPAPSIGAGSTDCIPGCGLAGQAVLLVTP